MSGLPPDVRDAIRALARAPALAAAAILSVAIGVGANTTMFSVANALLLRPLPYADADRLVILWNRSPGLGIAEDWFSTAQYSDIRTGHAGFEQVAIAIGGNDNLTGHGEPERLGTIRASSTLLQMLGARAEIGRLFTEAEDVEGGPRVAVLEYGTWVRRFGADPRALGRSIGINGQPYEIVGVLPASFSLPREVMPTLGGAQDAEIILPLPLGAAAAGTRNREDYNLLGKLKPGVTIEEAQAQMDTITARLRREHPEFYPPNGGLTFGIVPLAEQVVGPVRRTIAILLGAVACVLLVACANVANLLLAQGLARQKEMALRQALGASRLRIVRQVLAESLLIGAAGGVVGLLGTAASLHAIRQFGTGSVPRLASIDIDGRVLLFTVALSVLSGVLFGLLPGWRLGRLDVHGTLKDTSRGLGTGWGRGQAPRRLLVVGELALSIVLLVAAGLLLRSFAALQRVDPGFNPAHVLTLELTMSGSRYGDAEKVLAAYRQLWEALAQLPGVTAAGGVSALPLSQMFAWGPIVVEGRTPAPGEAFVNVDQRIVGADYFRTLQIPIRQGRRFTDRDTRDTPRVAIVDERMAADLWPGQSPLGQRVRTGGFDAGSPWITVVGVAGAVKQYTLDGDSRMAMYLPHRQYPTRAMNVVLRTGVEPAGLAGAVREVLRRIDPDLPMYKVHTMEERVAASLATRRFSMLLLSVFAVTALGLAAVGIAGVMAYLVGQGTRELGIRLALGATPRQVRWWVVRQGLVLAAAGVALGLAGALALTRSMQGLLFGVAPADLPTFAATAALLGAVALVASYGPARRAARVDPLISLRAE
jgi:predicted permease